ncbi:MAG: flavin monoamine oxidase family protein [Gammaproteobacteria bacterium]
MLDVAVIGGGLAGLALAQRLQAEQRCFALFEARERFGGRILSLAPPSSQQSGEETFRSDLGPSWIWPDEQPRIAAFVAEHDLAIYAQWQQGKSLYQSDRLRPAQAFIDRTTYAAARRIAGGTYRLVEALLAKLPPASLHLQQRLQSLSDRGDHVELRFDNGAATLVAQARQVVLTLPPRLLAESVAFDPPLDARLRQVMRHTATWMAGHAKAAIYYRQAFWRQADYSGSVLANYPGAALAEIFDACAADGEPAVLSGFFALPAALRNRYRDDLEALVIAQLVALFGKAAAQPEAVVIQDWFAEPCTAASADATPPPSHPLYGHPWLQLDHWHDKLFFGGTETSSEYGGYLEGALASAERIAHALSISDRCHLQRRKMS